MDILPKALTKPEVVAVISKRQLPFFCITERKNNPVHLNNYSDEQ